MVTKLLTPAPRISESVPSLDNTDLTISVESVPNVPEPRRSSRASVQTKFYGVNDCIDDT